MKKIAVALVIIVAMLTIYLAFFGLFHSVDIVEKEISDPIVFVYDKHLGPYRDSVKIADNIYEKLRKEYGIDTLKGIGIYYDKPETVDDSKLRSVTGCILDRKYLNKRQELEKSYKVGELPAGRYVSVVFPFKGNMSILLGIFRVYPKLTDYIAKKKYPAAPLIEVYDVPNKKIEYLAGVDISDEVYSSFLR